MKLISGHRLTSSASLKLGLLGLWLCSAPVSAVDGVIEINQARALAGGVTPGDPPGFAVIITEAGSYRLTSNLDLRNEASPENQFAILITTSNVEIDLNGFSIIGPNSCSASSPNPPLTINCAQSGTGIGISTNFPLDNISIRNGNIQGMGNRGISLNPNGKQHRLENLNISHNGDRGITGGDGIYRSNKVSLNYGYGIIGGNGIYSDNFTVYNGFTGLRGKSGVFSGNTSTHNGTDGIESEGDGTYINNLANFNSGIGLTGDQGPYTNNSASYNGLDGISGGTGSYTGNTTFMNKRYGIEGSVGAYVGNTSVGNTQEGLKIAVNAGYAQNVMSGNNGGDANPQVSGGIQLGTNICGPDTICP